jgi:2,5-furandicarboxylate decarboxylase 1
MYDLKSFLSSLEGKEQHLVKVQKEVDPKFEACAVIQRLAYENRHPAVFYEKVKGSSFPAISNVFADRERIALAFGISGRELNQILRERESNPLEPQMVKDGHVQEVVWTGNQIDLTKLPIFTHNEKDAGPYITGGMMVVRDPETGIRNVGIYRHMLQGKSQLGIHLAETGHGRLVFDKHMARGQSMPVAITIGHHPLVYLGSLSFVPFGVDEYTIMGGFMQEPLRLVKCKTVDLEVPADAEIVVEGTIPRGEAAMDGPFGEYTTVYGKVRENPVIKVSAITMRKNPIYFDVLSGYIDHQLLGGTPRLSSIYRAIRTACPTIQDVNMPTCGCCRFTCYISIKKRHEGEAKNALAAAFGADQFIKLAVAVDDDVDIFSDSAMLLALNTRLKPLGNVFVIPNAKTNALDPTVENELLVTKIGIDATKPLAGFPETVRIPGSQELDLSKYI